MRGIRYHLSGAGANGSRLGILTTVGHKWLTLVPLAIQATGPAIDTLRVAKLDEDHEVPKGATVLRPSAIEDLPAEETKRVVEIINEWADRWGITARALDQLTKQEDQP